MSELSEWGKLSTDMKVDLLRNLLDSVSQRQNRLYSLLESFEPRLHQVEQKLHQFERQRPDKA